jgi:signal transduction histidine kinase
MTEAPKILVVDDDAAGRYLKAHILRKNGYDVTEAADGGSALRQCREIEPALVLLDMRLPDIHGVEVCRQIKAAFPGTAVLQTSAAITSARDRAEALDGGADSFLVEPIEPEELLAIARALLRLRSAEHALRRLNDTLENLVAERTRELSETNRQLEIESAERRKAEEVLWHAQKLEAVGQVTGGIAHDFNNLLAVIVGSLELIRSGLESPRELPRDRMLRMLTAAETATDRGAKLTRQLLTFARRGTLRAEVVSLDEVIAACEPFFRRALGETISLHMTFQSAPWRTRLDPVQFEAAVLNLVVNARDAMPDGGQLSIVVENVSVDAAMARRTPPLTVGDYVLVRVTDTGTGMEPDVVPRVFEPFFTTKEVGKGTGLGLSQVYGFVRQCNGHVLVDTAPGQGTTFRLYLPRCEAVAEPVVEAPARSAAEAHRGVGTVLVVEDNAEVLELAVATISELGYQVVAAPNGPAALDILLRDNEIDLLFSDVVMPGGMNGFDLVRKARAIRDGLKAVLTSGYANVQCMPTGQSDVALLAKPYRRLELAERIRSAMDRP